MPVRGQWLHCYCTRASFLSSCEATCAALKALAFTTTSAAFLAFTQRFIVGDEQVYHFSKASLSAVAWSAATSFAIPAAAGAHVNVGIAKAWTEKDSKRAVNSTFMVISFAYSIGGCGISGIREIVRYLTNIHDYSKKFKKFFAQYVIFS